MKVLLTGNRGFIGTNFEERLTGLGHTVFGYDPKPTPVFEVPNVEGYDLVIHLGAQSSTTASRVEATLDQNYDFSYKLLMACNSAGVNMQYASSASVYGHVSKWNAINELYEPSPQNLYAWSKYLFDRLVMKSLPQLDIKVQGFRYFNVWGPHEKDKAAQASLFHKWIKLLDKGETFKLFEGSDSYYRDFIHVDDVFNLQFAMVDNPDSGIFNIGTGTSTSIEQLAIDVCKKFDRTVDIVPMPSELQAHYQVYTKADNQKILEATKLTDYKFITVEDVNEDLIVQS